MGNVPRGLKLWGSFHRYFQKWFYAPLKNGEIFAKAAVSLKFPQPKSEDNSNFNLTFTPKGSVFPVKNPTETFWTSVCIHVCTSTCTTHTLYAKWCLLVFTRVEQSQFGPGQVWNYSYNYLHISPAKKNLPGCFSANYFIIVVGALLLMASTALCVGLHEILNRRLALFWST